MIRDLVRGVQQLRKDRGLEVTDRIELYLYASDELREAVEGFQEHLTAETLAESWSWGQRPDAVKIECGQEVCLASLRRAGEKRRTTGTPRARRGGGGS
jgi:isoleucyl-tRNA synthetase